MKILSIDPGYDRVGMAVLEKDGGKEKIVFSVCFQTDKKAETDDRIFAACSEIERLIKEYSPEVFAIENLFFTKNQKTAMAVAQARGAFIQTAKKAELPVMDLTPLQIKTATAGHGGASKDEVHKMVSMICKLENRKYIDDEIDAIAVGISAFSYLKTFKIHKENS